MSKPKNLHVSQRMAELMTPIDVQIMMCDDTEDIMMLACGMMQRVKEILDQRMGVEGRKMMFKEYGQGDYKGVTPVKKEEDDLFDDSFDF